MKSSNIRKIALTIVALAAAGGVAVWFFNHEEAPRSSLVFYGNVEIRQVEAAFQATERVAKMLVEEGDTVKKGQLLATVETERLKAAVDRSTAQVQSQQQVLQRLETGSRPQEIRKARADLAAAKAKAADAESNLQRLKKAVGTGAVSRQDVDSAHAQKKVAQANLNAAEEALSLAVEGPRQEDIDAAKATLSAYQAEMVIARKNLADANLYSPESAIVQERILEPGDMASPHVPAYLLALTDPVWVRVFVPETDLGKIKPGMDAAVRTDSFPDKTYQGWVGYISPTAEFTPKTVETEDLRTSLVYQVRVYVKNPQNELRLGMPATVKIKIRNSNN